MASISDNKSVNATLSGTTVDTVTINSPWPIIEVVNRSASEPLWVRSGRGAASVTDPVAGAEGAEVVMPGERITIASSRNPALGAHVVKILGNGNDYAVVGSAR